LLCLSFARVGSHGAQPLALALAGYPSFKGSVFDGEHLRALLQGLADNQLLPGYTHLLTGYIGSVSILEQVVDVCRQLKAANGGQLTYGARGEPTCVL
jgi:pyridoxal/pyridoxine/pyridoxamine kinase